MRRALIDGSALRRPQCSATLPFAARSRTVDSGDERHPSVPSEDRIVTTSDDRISAPHLLVVIDHHEARVYRTEVRGAVLERIVPYDPHGFGRHLHSAHEWTDGKRPAERKSYYEAVAKTLRGAGQVLVFGSGSGRSSAVEQLLADLKDHHPDVSGAVVGSVVVDAHHTTENELLAQARAFYAEYNRA